MTKKQKAKEDDSKMTKKVIRIFTKCYFCPFCADKHIKEITDYYTKYMCRKSDYREINKKDLGKFPDWCPLEDETVVDFTKAPIILM